MGVVPTLTNSNQSSGTPPFDSISFRWSVVTVWAPAIPLAQIRAKRNTMPAKAARAIRFPNRSPKAAGVGTVPFIH